MTRFNSASRCVERSQLLQDYQHVTLESPRGEMVMLPRTVEEHRTGCMWQAGRITRTLPWTPRSTDNRVGPSQRRRSSSTPSLLYRAREPGTKAPRRVGRFRRAKAGEGCVLAGSHDSSSFFWQRGRKRSRRAISPNAALLQHLLSGYFSSLEVHESEKLETVLASHSKERERRRRRPTALGRIHVSQGKPRLRACA